MPVAAQRALLDQYCVGCHNQKAKTGGLALDNLDLSNPADNAETLERVIRKLRAGMMPPPSDEVRRRLAVQNEHSSAYS
jgi:mono/diheme cytochrome c family protein